MARTGELPPRGANGEKGAKSVRVMGDDEGIDVVAPATLAVLNRSEIDVQIATAKRWPRSIAKFRADATALATLDQETAESMGYALPRGGKPIVGPSVRLAEIVGSTWGNLRYGARIVEIGQERLVAQGACHDLETNNAVTVEVTRRITYKGGERFNEDMIAVTAQAAMSIALRNAIFRIVPMAYVNTIYRSAMDVAVGQGQPMPVRRQRALDWITQHQGGTQADMLLVLGRRGMDDVTLEDLEALQGLKTAIKDGDTTWEKVVRDARARVAREAPATEQPEAPAAVGDRIAEDSTRAASTHAMAGGGSSTASAGPSPTITAPPKDGPAPIPSDKPASAPPPATPLRDTVPSEPEYLDLESRVYGDMLARHELDGTPPPDDLEARVTFEAKRLWTAGCPERAKADARKRGGR